MFNPLGASRKPINTRINRDPDNQLDFVDIGSQQRSGLVSSAPGIRSAGSAGIRRGQDARATMTYEKMMRFGGGAAASRMQKNAFSKLAK